MNAPAPTLTFAALDGIAFAAAKGRLNGHVAGPALIAAELGPLLELAQFAAVGLLPPPERTPWLSLDGTASLAAALACGRSAWVCPETRRAGLFRLAPEYPADDCSATIGIADAPTTMVAGLGEDERVMKRLSWHGGLLK